MGFAAGTRCHNSLPSAAGCAFCRDSVAQVIPRIQRSSVYEQRGAKSICYRMTTVLCAKAYIDEGGARRDNETNHDGGFYMSTLRAVIVSGGAMAAIVVEAIASCLWIESCWEQFQTAGPAFGLP